MSRPSVAGQTVIATDASSGIGRQAALARFGRVDILVNNAGIGLRADRDAARGCAADPGGEFLGCAALHSSRRARNAAAGVAGRS